MRKPALAATLLLALSACSTSTPPPSPTPIAASTQPPAPKPPVEIQITDCGYGAYGMVTMSGTVTNNTIEALAFLDAAVALIKNGQVLRTDKVSFANATGENAGLLHGLDYDSRKGGLAPEETLEWRIAYPLDTLTQPFECEASITSAR